MSEQPKRKFEGIWIPAEIWQEPSLTMQEKVLWAEIKSLDNERGCYASNAYFAEFFGISSRRVQQLLSSLITKGYIRTNVIYNDDTKQVSKRIMNVVVRGEKNFTPPTKNISPPSRNIFQGGGERNFVDRIKNDNIVDNKEENALTRARKDFVKPELIEVEEFFNDEGYSNDEAEKFFYYYESIDWYVGETKMNNWRSAARSWIRKIPEFETRQTNSARKVTLSEALKDW